MSLLASIIRRAWPVPVISMLVIGALGMWRPGLWADELATWGAVELPWRQMWGLLRNTDAVNGGYYAVIKVWTAIAGTSEFALRLPSLLAMTAAAGLTAVTAARLWTPRWGILAGLVFAILPMTSRYAAEARGYAFAIAFAALATYLLVRLFQTGQRRLWIYYAISVVAVGFFHLIAVLMLTGHMVLVAIVNRRLWWPWLISAVSALVVLSPLAVMGVAQRGQTSWIEPLSLAGLSATPDDLFESRWTALVVAILLIVAVWRFRNRTTIAVAAVGLTPIAALLLVSLVVDLWVPRYLLFAVPAWALLAGRAVAGLRWTKPAVVVLVVVIAVSGAGAQYDIRRTSGHTHDTIGAAAVITADYREGDGLAVALDEPVVPWEARDLVARYVPRESRPRDVFARTGQRTDGQLLATECSPAVQCLGETQRIWVIRYQNPTDPLDGIGAEKEAVLREQFQLDRTWPLRGLTVALLSRR